MVRDDLPVFWKYIDIKKYAGTFVTLCDLDNDGRVDFLLSYLGPYSAHLRLIALDHDGQLLWEFGDPSITGHASGLTGDSGNPCRGICLGYDLDTDGETEVLVEFWNDGAPKLYLLEGATGVTKVQVPSPFSLAIRYPEGCRPSRPSPMGLIAYLRGRKKAPAAVLKYEASHTIPTHAVALDGRLNTLWQVQGLPTAMGHSISTADIDGDGQDELILGELAVDGNGDVIYEKRLGAHADMVDVFEDGHGSSRIVVSVCVSGPVYCLEPNGNVVWQLSKEDVPHGQAVWAGNFIPDRAGTEVMILASGHYGRFLTVDAEDGSRLAEFQHRAGLTDRNGDRKYPDMPAKANWVDESIPSLWIPVDRSLVDGSGQVVQDLGRYDDEVANELRAGTNKKNLAVQAIATDLCGDDRDELLLYQPYQGRGIFVFTQSDSSCEDKPYFHRAKTYNRSSYF